MNGQNLPFPTCCFSALSRYVARIRSPHPCARSTLPEAAEFLRVHPETLRQLARTGKMPGAKVGRAWVFLEEDLAAVPALALSSAPRQALRVTLRKEVKAMSLRKRGVSLVDRPRRPQWRTSTPICWD